MQTSYIRQDDEYKQCTLNMDYHEGVSLSMSFTDFIENENWEDEMRAERNDLAAKHEMLSDYVEKTLDLLFKSYNTINIQAIIGATYANKDGVADEAARYYSTPTLTMNNNTVSRADFRERLYKLFYPKFMQQDDTKDRFEGNEDASPESEPYYMERLETVDFRISFPTRSSARGLLTSYRLNSMRLSRYIKYCPYNSDNYCVLHCLFNELYDIREKTDYKSLQKDEEYMKQFNYWFNTNKLSDFYDSRKHFCMHMIDQLEKRLEVSICVYDQKGVGDDDLELYYRSKFEYNDIVYLAIVPMYCFKKRNTDEPVKVFNKKASPVIYKEPREGIVFGYEYQLKDYMKTVDCHAMVLKTSYFKKGDDKYVCPYCTVSSQDPISQNHLDKCHNHIKTSADPNKRLITYGELKNPMKRFVKYFSLYRVPFCTYDFETRLDSNGAHVPFSYAICYFNVFDPAKSIVKMVSDFDDPEGLINLFLKDCAKLASYHYKLQSVDFYEGVKETFDDKMLCGLCNERTIAEFNHSHFKGDTLNSDLDRYVCKECNMKMTIKDKPLQFYAHNAIKFDNALFMKELLDSDLFFRKDIIPKSESKFTQIVVSLKGNSNIKLAFKDSLMLIMGSLDGITKAWINKDEHRPIIRSMVKKFYKLDDDKTDKLTDISFNKAVFPYSCLNEKKYLDVKEPLEQDLFYNTLRGKECSDSDYKTYLDSNSVLQECIGDTYKFLDYHDYYLFLDVALLGVVMYSFMQSNYKMTGINPLWYMSASSFSYDAMLYSNSLNKQIPTVVIPDVQTQLYLQKSVRGGFSSIFTRLFEKEEKDLILYEDVTSLYPSTFLEKLPYEHIGNLVPTMDVYRKIIDELKPDDDLYYFIEVDIKALDAKYHKRNSIYPLFPENVTIESEWLSPGQKVRYQMNSGREYSSRSINTVTFHAKKNYVCAATYLKEAEKLGYEIENVHRIEVFKAGHIMRDYCLKMYELKKQYSIQRDELKAVDPDDVKIAELSSLISVSKLILNGLYGFNLTRSDKFTKCEIISASDEDKLNRRFSSYNFKSFLKSGNNYIMNMHPPTTQLCYATMIGSAILWQSKLVLIKYVYNLYDYIEEKVGPNKFIPLFTDTDSYAVAIRNFYDVFNNKDEFMYDFNKNVYTCFDTSFFKDESLKMPETHAALGLLTDETEGKGEITKFAGLCSKVYAYTTDFNKGNIRSKGVPKAIRDEMLNFEFYKSIVTGSAFGSDFDPKEFAKVTFTQIRSARLRLENLLTKKRLVTFYDLKYRYDDGVHYKVHGSTVCLGQLAFPLVDLQTCTPRQPQ